MRSTVFSSLSLSLTAMLALGLTGCASMTQTEPGTPIAAVEQKFGEPTITCALPDGGYRAVWSEQPYGHYAWATDVNAQGNVGDTIQVLDDRVFNQALSQGVWDAERVKCMFGPPADINNVGLPSVTKTVWAYRYFQNGVWYSLMYVFFDPATNLVIEHYAGPDPMFMFDGDRSE